MYGGGGGRRRPYEGGGGYGGGRRPFDGRGRGRGGGRGGGGRGRGQGELIPIENLEIVGTEERQLSTVVPGRSLEDCLLYTSPSPRDATLSRMPSSA